MFLEIWQNSQEDTCARVSFLIKLQALGVKNTFFTEHLSTTASNPLVYKNWPISDFRLKVWVIYSLLKNGSEIHSWFTSNGDQFLLSISFTSKETGKVIWSCDPDKTYTYNRFCIRFLKICGLSLCQSLGIIYKSCIKYMSLSSLNGKRTNIVPVYEKRDKQLLKDNYIFIYHYVQLLANISPTFLQKMLC